MTNSAKTIKKNSTTAWTNRAKNSASLMQITLDAIDHMLSADKDWTVLAHHISKGIDSKAPPKELANIKLIVSKVATGIKMVKDDKQPSGIRINAKDVVFDIAAKDKVLDLIKKNVSIGGTAIASALDPKADDAGEAELDYIKAANNLLKRGFNPDALIAAIQAASRQAA
jgi:hypothetical protein